MSELEKFVPIPKPIEKGDFEEEVDGVKNTYYFMTMDFLGKNLTSLVGETIEERFSEGTVINLMQQIIKLL